MIHRTSDLTLLQSSAWCMTHFISTARYVKVVSSFTRTVSARHLGQQQSQHTCHITITLFQAFRGHEGRMARQGIHASQRGYHSSYKSREQITPPPRRCKHSIGAREPQPVGGGGKRDRSEGHTDGYMHASTATPLRGVGVRAYHATIKRRRMLDEQTKDTTLPVRI